MKLEVTKFPKQSVSAHSYVEVCDDALETVVDKALEVRHSKPRRCNVPVDLMFYFLWDCLRANGPVSWDTFQKRVCMDGDYLPVEQHYPDFVLLPICWVNQGLVEKCCTANAVRFTRLCKAKLLDIYLIIAHAGNYEPKTEQRRVSDVLKMLFDEQCHMLGEMSVKSALVINTDTFETCLEDITVLHERLGSTDEDGELVKTSD